MRLLAASVGCLLSVSWVIAKPSVTVLQVQPSSQNARITVLHNGNPLPEAKVAVFTADDQPRVSLATDERGVVVLPALPPGRYHVAVDASDGLGGDLVLQVSKHKGKKTSEFTLALFVRPPAPPTLAERIAAAEESAPNERLRTLHGIAVDPTGAAIPHVRLQIFKKGSGAKTPLAITESDDNGHFFVRLAKGTYTAVLQAQGFSTGIYVFEITEDGEQKESRIRLDPGPVT
jgi:hypothetical protein